MKWRGDHFASDVPLACQAESPNTSQNNGTKNVASCCCFDLRKAVSLAFIIQQREADHSDGEERDKVQAVAGPEG